MAAGPAAVAGFGTAARLEYLLVPLVFGFGGPLVAMVGTNIGAGQRERALRIAWIGAAHRVRCCTEIDRHRGGALSRAPGSRCSAAIPPMLEAGSAYLRAVGPFYGCFGFGLALYFASQGAGKLLWPLIAGFARVAVAIGGGWLALHAARLARRDVHRESARHCSSTVPGSRLRLRLGAWFGLVRFRDTWLSILRHERINNPDHDVSAWPLLVHFS